ncbi:MAG: metallophosphoesterase [Saprospiraceae bacterium]|nr:metallophosphoesterase [Saprospiraceae bacterium]
MKKTFDILFFADSHLGHQLPQRRKSNRRYRGDDFFANVQRVLEIAVAKQVDLIIHGGDVFEHSKVSEQIIGQTYDMLFNIADQGIPIVIVPGNHDKSTLPQSLFLQHPNIHIGWNPSVYTFSKGRMDIAICAIPYVRKIGLTISDILDRLESMLPPRVAPFLLMHQAIEGAQVGPANYTFRKGDKVIAKSQLKGPYVACLSGHIHRHQILCHGPGGFPVFYPGSIERTSFAEIEEEKGFLVIQIDEDRSLHHEFNALPAREMHRLNIPGNITEVRNLREWLVVALGSISTEAVIKIGCPTAVCASLLRSEPIKSILASYSFLSLSHTWIERRIPKRQA